MSGRITITQVARSMGVELDNATAWSIGAGMADKYVREFGEQPPKELRPKTSGGGSHCFAVYPPTWESHIRRSIQAHADFTKQQLDMFSEEAP
jgi:hypothetical protein